jgi:hypothetical protein
MNTMHATWSDLIAGYIVLGSAAIGIPAIFFIITFLPGLMRTTGEEIGRKEQDKLRLPPEATRSLSEIAARGQRQ